MIRITQSGRQYRIVRDDLKINLTQKDMPGISVSKICVPFGGGGIDWSSYWATLLTTIGYTHPMLPGLTLAPSGSGYVITSHSINDFRKTVASPVVKYVNGTTGLDTNNGDTAGTAYKTLDKLATITCTHAYIKSGVYATTDALFNNGDMEFIADGETFICRGYHGSGKSWTDAGGGVFTCSQNPTYVVVDTALIDANGDPTALKKVANTAAVAATAGTFYLDGNTLNVHMYDGLTPNRASVLLVAYPFYAPVVLHTYMENITLIGGFNNYTGDTASEYIILAKGCKFLYTITDDSCKITGHIFSWFEDCVFARSQADAISYKKGAGIYIPSGVEVNCICRHCGGADNYGTNNGINNGSTAHEGAVILRVNGEYYGTEGPCVHDIDASQSLNINCHAHDSNSEVAGNKSAFAVGIDGGADTAKMWLYECTTSGATTFGAERRAALAHIYDHGSTIHSVEPGTVVETF